MEIEALSTFTAFDGAMRVFNKGDCGELSDDLARQYVSAGQAKPISEATSDTAQSDEEFSVPDGYEVTVKGGGYYVISGPEGFDPVQVRGKDAVQDELDQIAKVKMMASATGTTAADQSNPASEDITALREQYAADHPEGKKPFNDWDAETLKAKIAEFAKDGDTDSDQGAGNADEAGAGEGEGEAP